MQYYRFFHLPGLQWIQSSDTSTFGCYHCYSMEEYRVRNEFFTFPHWKRFRAELYEACGLDGARKWQRFRDITIPSISPTTFFYDYYNGKFAPGIRSDSDLTQGGPSGSTRTLLYMYYQLGFEEFDMGQATAVAMVMIVLTVGLSAIQFRASKKWVHY